VDVGAAGDTAPAAPPADEGAPDGTRSAELTEPEPDPGAVSTPSPASEELPAPPASPPTSPPAGVDEPGAPESSPLDPWVPPLPTRAREDEAVRSDTAATHAGVPDDVRPDDVRPDEAVPDEAVPDEAVPDEAVHPAPPAEVEPPVLEWESPEIRPVAPPGPAEPAARGEAPPVLPPAAAAPVADAPVGPVPRSSRVESVRALFDEDAATPTSGEDGPDVVRRGGPADGAPAPSTSAADDATAPAIGPGGSRGIRALFTDAAEDEPPVGPEVASTHPPVPDAPADRGADEEPDVVAFIAQSIGSLDEPPPEVPGPEPEPESDADATPAVLQWFTERTAQRGRDAGPPDPGAPGRTPAADPGAAAEPPPARPQGERPSEASPSGGPSLTENLFRFPSRRRRRR
jgi:hypothetical protein